MQKVIQSRAVLPSVLTLLLAGLLLRLFFVHRFPFVAGDSTLYLDIAQSWIDSHTYGLSTVTVPRPTLIRLPGYPMVLAGLQLLFPWAAKAPDGSGIFSLVMRMQVGLDLGSCVLIAMLARRKFGDRSGLSALALAALCPFLANYTAAPLTESFVLFTIALAYWAADAWRQRPRFSLLLLTACALGGSILLRPDQVLLAAAVLPLFWKKDATSSKKRWLFVLFAAALTALPLVPWTVRNAVTFHTFQPLAPKSATDPGEPVDKGFQHWFRTFAVDFTATEDAYWNYPENAIDPRDLPDRAFDTPAQRAETFALLREASRYRTLQPHIEAEFERLAQQRIRAHPLRYYVGLPLARLVNMVLHPRVEMLPVDERWWRFQLHPAQTLFASFYGMLNLLYFALAAAGVPRAWRAAPALTASLLAFFALRCALLLTLDNAEQRYTMELLPVAFLLSSACFSSDATRSTQPRRHFDANQNCCRM